MVLIPPSEPLRIAVLGLGFMGSTHLKALRSVRGAKLAAVFSHDETKLSGDLTGVRGNLGGPGEKLDFTGVAKYREIAHLLADPEIDAVDICLPTDAHEPVAIQALRAGKHVLVEKPMALDGASADRVIEAAEGARRVLMTAHVLRFLPEYEVLRETIQGGQAGAPRFASFRRRCAAPGWGGWLLDPVSSGGGAFDLLIHDADMCLHLFGAPDAVSATGYADNAAGIDCIDAQLYYANGPAVGISGGWHNPGAFPFSMEYTVTFDGATIDYSSAGRPPTIYSAGGQVGDLPHEGDGYVAEIGYFVECCRTGRVPEICPPRESRDAVALMRLLLASRERNGEKIACNL